VSTEETVRDRVLAIMLDQDELTSRGLIQAQYKRKFPRDHADDELIKSVLYDLIRHDVLIEHDTENESLDGALIDHNEYGQLSISDMSFIGIDELVALGPKSVVLVHTRASQIAEQAANGGLGDALAHLNSLPVDSRKWTGLPVGFTFDEGVKLKVLQLLREADEELGRLRLGNQKTSQARALIKAATILAEAPQPETELVWKILQRLADVVGLISGVDGIMKIFRPL